VQHAYYYGQTDPSVYNSPWPPVQQDGHSNVHTPSAPATSQPHTMTYMQPTHQSPVDSQQSYDTSSAPSYATTLHNFDVGSFGMGHDVHSQQQHQARKSPSNMYFEDASMHLKMQSLPILNSLVSLPLLAFFTRHLDLISPECSVLLLFASCGQLHWPGLAGSVFTTRKLGDGTVKFN
jgi:hypothetical protein